MRPWELFNKLRNLEYTTVGRAVDYCIHVDLRWRAIWLFFEESNQRRDWVTNLRFCPRRMASVNGRNIYVHGGFLGVWREVKSRIFDELLQALAAFPGFTVKLAGFSKGAAMAQLSAFDWHLLTGETPEVTTFGGPRIAFNTRSRDVMSNSMRLIHWIHVNDIITKVPPLPLGFFHVNRQVNIGRRGIFGIFNPNKYHQLYGDPSLYA